MTRLNKTIDYIEGHLTDEIDYDALAQIACCSSYHYQRMFAYMAGVPLSEYIRRRRMSLTVADLQSGEKIVNVSLKYGYSSPTAFNRAFQGIHGVAPPHVKDGGIAPKSFSPISFKITIKGAEEMEYRIEKKDTIRIVGISVPMSKNIEENFETIPPLWGKRPDFGPSWPEMAGVWGWPQQAIFCGLSAGQITKNVQLWPQLPCLPFSESSKIPPLTEKSVPVIISLNGRPINEMRIDNMPRNPERNQEQREIRKEQILKEALRHFSQKGLYETKIKDIAQQIGVAQGLIYHYYSSKEEIYAELIRDALDKMIEAAYTLNQMELSSREKIVFAVEQLISTMENSYDFNQTCLLIAQATNSTAVPESVKQLLELKRGVPYQVISAIMSEGQRDGFIIDADPDELAVLFWTMLNGLAIYRATRQTAAKLPSPQLITRIFLKEI